MICIDVAEIVARQNFVGQTASLPQTAIYSVSADGLYRISINSEFDDVSLGFSPRIHFTNNSGPWIFTTNAGNRDGIGSFCIYCTSGSTIDLSIDVTGSPILYTTSFVVEKF